MLRVPLEHFHFSHGGLKMQLLLGADLETKLEEGLGEVNCEQELIELEYKIAALLGGLCGSICTETI